MKFSRSFFVLFLLMLSFGCTSFAASAVPLYGPTEFVAGWFGIHASHHRFSAVETGEGLLTVEKISTDKMLRGGLIYINGQCIRLGDFFRSGERKLEQNVQIGNSNHLGILFLGDRGAAISVTVSAASSNSVQITQFLADPETIKEGESASLSWTTENAESVSIEPGIGSVAQSGTMNVTPSSTTTYTLTAVNQDDSQSTQTTVVVLPLPPMVNLSVEPQTIVSRNKATINWQTDRADAVSIDQGIGEVAPSGSRDVAPLESTTYTLTASNTGGTTTSAVTVEVVPIGITIESPIDQSRVAAPSIAVKGRIQTAAQYVEVSVNNRHALVNSNEFLVPDLPLELGENIITVQATDSDGNIAQAESIVTRSETGDWLELQLGEAGGFTPLETGLTIVPHLQTTLNWDTAILEESGPADVVVEGTAEEGYQLTFTEPGLYSLDFQVRDVDSTMHEEGVFVSVLPPFTAADWQAMNEGVQQLEDRFTALLATEGVESARQQVLEQAKENPDFPSATLSSGALCLVFKGLIPVILDLPDPNAPLMD